MKGRQVSQRLQNITDEMKVKVIRDQNIQDFDTDKMAGCLGTITDLSPVIPWLPSGEEIL